MRVVLVLVTLLVVSFAGCVSDDDPEPAGGDAAPSTKNPGDSARPSVTAEEEDAPVTEEVEVVVPYQETYTGSGSTSTGLWVCDSTAGTGECNGHEISAESRIVTFEYPDRMTAASIVMTWERVDSSYRFLVAEVTAIPASGDEVLIFSGFEQTPMTMDIPEIDVGPGTLQVEVWVRSDYGAGPAYLFADPQTQPFDLEATLTMLPSA